MNAVFAVTPNSVRAVMVRDLMARYGRNNIGFLWALIEPIILAAGVMGLWSIIRAPYEHGIALMAIVFTGYLPLTLWRHINNNGPGLFLRAGHYLFHRNISLLDIFIARAISEFAFTTAGSLLIYAVLRLFGLLDPVERWDLVIGGWLVMWVLSSSFMLLMACLTALYEDLEKFNMAVQYLLLPISGCFFMMDWVSESARSILWYVPLTHCYEMIRDGVFGQNTATYYDAWYPLLWSIVMALVSLNMLTHVREDLHGQ